MNNKRFTQYQVSLRSYLRKRGAVIDVRNKTIDIDKEQLNRKEEYRLNELLKYGYKLKDERESVNIPYINSEQGESFIAFADEIMSYYDRY